MTKALEVLKNRRVIVALIGGLAFLGMSVDVPVLSDLIGDFTTALANLIMAGLALWSYLKPKNVRVD